MDKKRVAVIGATGVAGQQFLAALAGHPYFEVAALAASARSAGKPYREAITDGAGAFRWYCAEPLDPAFAEMTVEDAARLDADALDLVFTAVESDAARELEPRFARDHARWSRPPPRSATSPTCPSSSPASTSITTGSSPCSDGAAAGGASSRPCPTAPPPGSP